MGTWYLLECVPSDRTSKAISVDRFPYSIGRDQSSSLVLHDSGISKVHAELTTNNYQLFVRDLGSRNGTFLNRSQVVNSEMVKDGDLLRFGTRAFEVHYVHSSGPAGPPPTTTQPSISQGLSATEQRGNRSCVAATSGHQDAAQWIVAGVAGIAAIAVAVFLASIVRESATPTQANHVAAVAADSADEQAVPLERTRHAKSELPQAENASDDAIAVNNTAAQFKLPTTESEWEVELTKLLRAEKQRLFNALHPIGTAKDVIVHKVELGHDASHGPLMACRFTILWEGPVVRDGFTKAILVVDLENMRPIDLQVVGTNGFTNAEATDAAIQIGVALFVEAMNSQSSGN